MKLLKYIIVFFSIGILSSCTIEKTNFEEELINNNEFLTFEEVSFLDIPPYRVSIRTLGGEFKKGYNEVKLSIKEKTSGEKIKFSEVYFIPSVLNDKKVLGTSPHLDELQYSAEDETYNGYVIFTELSSNSIDWKLVIRLYKGEEVFSNYVFLEVKEQHNKNLNMVSFTANDNKEYVLALVSPTQPKVAENPLTAGLFIKNKPTRTESNTSDSERFFYSLVQNHKLLLDPRMPEPSMGNHSSPNNKDLIQGKDGLYHGMVNYTMTGNWTLNFMLLNEAEELLKGTEVPDAFTPGVEGERSELYLDILF